jgi:hypothetical protein
LSKSAFTAIILSPFSNFGNSTSCCIKVIFCSVGLGFGVFLSLYLYSMWVLLSSASSSSGIFMLIYFSFIFVSRRPCCPGGPFLSGKYSVSCVLRASPSLLLCAISGGVLSLGIELG